MSLSHTLFSLSPDQRAEVIHTIARKAASRREFDRLVRPLLHAKHAAGGSPYEMKMLRREWRLLFSAAKNEAV
jgi:hypothetical protein